MCCNEQNLWVVFRRSKGFIVCRICGVSQPIGTMRLTNGSLDGLSKISDNQGHD